MSVNNDFRVAAGLKRWPSALEDLTEDDPSSPPRGPGLFQVARANGETAITNIRRLAGTERAPGSRLVLAATILLGLLATGLFVVTLNAQYKYVFTVKQQPAPSMIEAASLDLGMAIFTLLALGLAMAGQTARIERALIVVCALGSAGQNYAAADVSSPRSVAAYVVPSLFLALVVDRVVAVVRRHVLGAAERSVWATVARAAALLAKGLGFVLLYLLRFFLAPPSTGAGLRRVVLNATPLPAGPPARPELQAVDEVPAIDPPPVIEPPELEGATKKARLRWWYEQDPACGDRDQAADAARRLCGRAGLGEGTARTYIYGFIADLDRRAS
jgi:hypothetical protein